MSRVDLFTPIHKAIRAVVYDAGLCLQRADPDDAGRPALDRLGHALGLLAEHHEHEERAIFPNVRSFEPEMIAELEAQHQEVHRRIAVTREALAAARAAAAGELAAACTRLDRRYNELTANYLTHLAHEEVTVLPATQEHFDDAQLAAMQGDIVSGMPTDRYCEWLRWMLPALNRRELTGMFAGMKASAPPATLDTMKKLATEVLEPQRWAAVSRAAGL